MQISFSGEAQDAFEDVVAQIPDGYTIAVVLNGQDFVDSGDLVPGQDVRLIGAANGLLVVLDLDPETQEPINEDDHRTIPLNIIDQIHVY